MTHRRLAEDEATLASRAQRESTLTAPATAASGRHPIRLWFAASLAALAGWVDAVAFVHWSGIYVSFMSGNSTTFAASLSTGDWSMALPVGVVVLSFVVGVMLGEWIAASGGRWGHALVLLTESAFLLAAAGASTTAETLWLPTILLAAGLGIQNATVYQLGGVSIAVSYVTGTLVNIGRGLADALGGAGPWHAPLPYVALWSALIAGAALGAIIAVRSAPEAIVVAALIALALSGRTAWITLRTGQA